MRTLSCAGIAAPAMMATATSAEVIAVPNRRWAVAMRTTAPITETTSTLHRRASGIPVISELTTNCHAPVSAHATASRSRETMPDRLSRMPMPSAMTTAIAGMRATV